MKKHLLAAAAALSTFTIASPASAAQVIATLGDYNGPSNTSGFPINLGTVGTFTYAALTGATITGAFLEGTYGTQDNTGSTASFNASVDGTAVTVCAINGSCFNGTAGNLAPFSIALPASSFASLLDGSASLAITQTSQTFVRYGTPTRRIVYNAAAVPEPASWAMMLIGFGGMGIAIRRRRTRVTATLAV